MNGGKEEQNNPICNNSERFLTAANSEKLVSKWNGIERVHWMKIHFPRFS
jgi:hypothetical protein